VDWCFGGAGELVGRLEEVTNQYLALDALRSTDSIAYPAFCSCIKILGAGKTPQAVGCYNGESCGRSDFNHIEAQLFNILKQERVTENLASLRSSMRAEEEDCIQYCTRPKWLPYELHANKSTDMMRLVTIQRCIRKSTGL
jgi:hypothetical protein